MTIITKDIPPPNPQASALQPGEALIGYFPIPGGPAIAKNLETAAAFMTGINKAAEPIINAFARRAFDLVSNDEIAKHHLQEAHKLLQTPQGRKTGLAHVIKAFASILPDGILNENFWNAAATLVGKNLGFDSELRAAKTQDILEITDTLESSTMGKWAEAWVTHDLVDHFLKGEIDSFLRLRVFGITVKAIWKAARKGL